MSATPQQQACIDSREGVNLVVACPGSGKSTTLANRCKELPFRESKKVLMFNAQAREDFSKKIGATSMTDVKTFHQFCMHEIWGNPEPYGYRRGSKLVKSGPFMQFKEANGLSGQPYEPRSWAEAGWDRSLAEWAENNLYTREVEFKGKVLADEIKKAIELNPSHPFGNPVTYQVKKSELETYKAIWHHREWLRATNQFTFSSVVRTIAENREAVRKAGDHVMVDEFQDVDRFQFDIVSALAAVEGTKSFMCVGDPNQLIYEWRGALPDSFERMQKTFPSARNIPLTTNFRSYDEILKHADEICPVGMTGVRGTGGPRTVEYFGEQGDDDDKNDVLAPFLNGATDYHNYAILCRYNRQCAKWQIHLARKGIPVHLIGKGDYWNSEHIKIAKEAWLNRSSVTNFFDSFVWQKIAKQKQFQDEDGQQELKELEHECRFVLELSHEDMKLLTDNFDNPRDGLKISTMHRTKGAEFPNVMVFGVNDNLKQDKFLYYVACSRARDRMVLA